MVSNRKLLISKHRNIGVQRYLAIGRQSQKVLAVSDTREGLARILKKSRAKEVLIIEKPRIREGTIQRVRKDFKKTEGYKKYYLGVF